MCSNLYDILVVFLILFLIIKNILFWLKEYFIFILNLMIFWFDFEHYKINCLGKKIISWLRLLNLLELGRYYHFYFMYCNFGVIIHLRIRFRNDLKSSLIKDIIKDMKTSGAVIKWLGPWKKKYITNENKKALGVLLANYSDVCMYWI